MTKIEEVKVETIEDTKQLKGTETIETIYPETIDLPTYDYWKSQNTIDANISIRNINWWWKVKAWYVSIPSWYTDYAITWIWFKPKAIQVVVHSWNKVAWWSADDIWWTIQQQCIYADSWAFSEQNWRLFRFDNINRWYLVSFDSDWFTVKSELNAVMIWTAFW